MARSRNQITTGRIGGGGYDLRHWKLTLFVAVVWGLPRLVCRVVSGRNLVGGGRAPAALSRRAACGVRGWGGGNPRGVWGAGGPLPALVLFGLCFTPPVAASVGWGVAVFFGGSPFYRHYQRVVHEKLMLRP